MKSIDYALVKLKTNKFSLGTCQHASLTGKTKSLTTIECGIARGSTCMGYSLKTFKGGETF
jgi:hypothetical protein